MGALCYFILRIWIVAYWWVCFYLSSVLGVVSVFEKLIYFILHIGSCLWARSNTILTIILPVSLSVREIICSDFSIKIVRDTTTTNSNRLLGAYNGLSSILNALARLSSYSNSPSHTLSNSSTSNSSELAVTIFTLNNCPCWIVMSVLVVVVVDLSINGVKSLALVSTCLTIFNGELATHILDL
jgi:hypothetical protein